MGRTPVSVAEIVKYITQRATRINSDLKKEQNLNDFERAGLKSYGKSTGRLAWESKKVSWFVYVSNVPKTWLFVRSCRVGHVKSLLL